MTDPWLLSWTSTRGHWGLLLPIILLTASVAEGASCTPKPIVMSMGNVTLGPSQVRRGLSIKLGNPQQELSVLPTWNNNNTIIYGPTCLDKTITNDKCRSEKGGLYDPAKSETVGTVNSDYKLPAEEGINPGTYSMITDNLTLADDFFIKDFPMMRATNDSTWNYGGYRPQHILGMHTGSSLLNTLYSAKSIATRSWGYYYGREGRNDNTAGSFILGGYDRAKTYGDGYTRSMEINENCGSNMIVTIQNLVLNLANGTDVSLFPTTSGGQGLMTCIYPEKPVLFDMPVEPYFNNWQSMLSHSLESRRSGGIDFWNEIPPQGQGYDGGLTFDFGSGFRISIPNNQLVVPDRMYNDKGELWANSSANVLRINALADSTATAFPALGRYFFQQAYIMANHETKQFTLWQANPTTAQDIVAVDETNKVIDKESYCANRTAPTVTPSASSTPTNNENTSKDQSTDTGRSTLETGAIVGIALGGLALVGLIIIGFWGWCHRRKRAAQKLLLVQQQMMGPPPPPPPPPSVAKEPTTSEWGLWPSQGQPHFIPQEMAAPRGPPRPLPVELPTTVH